MTAQPVDDLVERLRKGHWEDCALYTTDPAEGHSCDCDYPLHMEAAARIEAQEAHLHDYKENSAHFLARAERAESALAAAQADAQRYRWLRVLPEGIEFRDGDGVWRADALSGASLDAAIDAARSAKP